MCIIKIVYCKLRNFNIYLFIYFLFIKFSINFPTRMSYISENEIIFLLLGVQLCFRRFSPKFKVLFLKSDYVLMIQSIVRR